MFQRAAVADPAEHLLIEAPAGSGKTRVLVERVAWLVAQGHVRPADVQVVTFARKAAQVLRERLQAAGLGEVRAQTFHAWAYGLLMSVHTTSFRLVADAERAKLQRRLLVGMASDARWSTCWRQLLVDRNWSPTFAARELLLALSSLRDFGQQPSDLKRFIATFPDASLFDELLLELWRRFELVLDRNGAFDFPLLVRRATERLQNWPRGLRKPTAALKHVLIDEAQDASRDELALIHAASDRVATTWVGDPNQAVYAWRGAVGLDRPGAVHRPLQSCYRSDARIVSLVNAYVHAAIGKGGVPARAVRAPTLRPQLVCHPRYGEGLALRRILTDLSAQGLAPHDVLVLARCHAPLERLTADTRPWRGVHFATVHAAKGLEARAVVVLGVSDDRFGFPLPARTSPHPAVKTLATYDQAAEERRLLYVALTRARDHLYLLSDIERPSSLLQAIPRRSVGRATIKPTNS